MERWPTVQQQQQYLTWEDGQQQHATEDSPRSHCWQYQPAMCCWAVMDSCENMSTVCDCRPTYTRNIDRAAHRHERHSPITDHSFDRTVRMPTGCVALPSVGRRWL